jgi:hypothetical protein
LKQITTLHDGPDGAKQSLLIETHIHTRRRFTSMLRAMRKPARLSLTLAAAGLAGMCLAACGGGGSSSDAVAHVGDTPITTTAVNHWMATLAGGDYHQLSAKNTIPDGLVSEPPNYPRCVANLETAAARVPKRGLNLTGVQLLTKCRQLYQALRNQAVALLVNDQWLIALARDEGLTATDAEVSQLFKRVKAEEFPTEAAQQQYFASRKLSLADELFLLKIDLLEQKLLTKAQLGGKQAVAKFTEAAQRWTAKTTCRPGYVVQHCKEYTGAPKPTPSQPSASVMIEQIAAIATGRCINLAACARQ